MDIRLNREMEELCIEAPNFGQRLSEMITAISAIRLQRYYVDARDIRDDINRFQTMSTNLSAGEKALVRSSIIALDGHLPVEERRSNPAAKLGWDIALKLCSAHSSGTEDTLRLFIKLNQQICSFLKDWQRASAAS